MIRFRKIYHRQKEEDWEAEVYARSRNAEVAAELVRIIRQVEKETYEKGRESGFDQAISAKENELAQARQDAFAEIEKFVEETDFGQMDGTKKHILSFIKENKTK